MENRFMGSKAVFGLLTIVIAGISGIGASEASDNASAKKQPSPKMEGARNYDEMVTIPAGKFIFGRPGSTKEVSLRAYKIDKYEVTNKQFSKFNLDHKYGKGGDYYPVTMVSLIEASDHCAAMDKRLPTEQEWEKAARGTDGRVYPWGNKFEKILCITRESVDEGQTSLIAPVGSCEKGNSPYGVADMAGNVWEWTSSFDDRYSVLKGGSFFEDRNFAMTYSNLLSIPDDVKDYVGFRCVKDIK